MGADLIRIALSCLLIAAAPAHGARTFRVLDSATDLPVSGVRARVIIRDTLPFGIVHPIGITLGEWTLISDRNGEFSISSPWEDRAVVDSLTKEGYYETATLKEYRLPERYRKNPTIKYLTPMADLVVEDIRLAVHFCAEHFRGESKYQTGPAFSRIAVIYGQFKPRATTGRELQALREFCQFSSAMKEQADAGWPNIGTHQETRKSAQELIDDCSAPMPPLPIQRPN